jgi:hypothetical protein
VEVVDRDRGEEKAAEQNPVQAPEEIVSVQNAVIRPPTSPASDALIKSALSAERVLSANRQEIIVNKNPHIRSTKNQTIEIIL